MVRVFMSHVKHFDVAVNDFALFEITNGFVLLRVKIRVQISSCSPRKKPQNYPFAGRALEVRFRFPPPP